MEQLKRKIKERQPIVGAAVGSGMSAAAAELGGVDLLMVLSAGYFRSHGCSSIAAMMPYSNSNRLTWQIATQYVIPRIKHTPVFLGLCAQDPQINLDPYLLRAIKERGMVGVTNFPSVGFIDGKYREMLEETGLGFEREVEMLAQARKHSLMTIGFCFNSEEAITMTHAGIDILNLDIGWAEWRDVDFDEHQASLDWAVNHINAVISSVKQVTPKPYVVIFGGPVILPQDTIQIYQKTEAIGYMGGSTIERFPAASNITQTVREFKLVATRTQQTNRLGAIIGVSPAMQKVFEFIHHVAQTDAPVLILGESGTGKELVAREIHRLSNRNKNPFICWNCGAITETLAESELFGHEKGSFTGAINRRLGKFGIANGGTLFMDEVADLPLSVQASLLRAIQEKEIIRVGGEETIKVDVQLIAASNQNLGELIRSKDFRLDLYYRLNTVVLSIPPLRERQEDIPFLVWEFVREFSQKYNYPIPQIPKSVMDAFTNHTWPGNIRELRNAVEHCFILGQGKKFSIEWIEEMLEFDRILEKPLTFTAPELAQSSKQELYQAKRERLQEVLASHSGNKTIAARELGVSRKTIYNWLRG